MRKRKKYAKNPYEVTGAAAETRWRQPAADLFGPTPWSCAHVGVSTSGKSSQQITMINAVLPVMDRVVIFSHSISPHSSTPLDPAWQELRENRREGARTGRKSRNASLCFRFFGATPARDCSAA